VTGRKPVKAPKQRLIGSQDGPEGECLGRVPTVLSSQRLVACLCFPSARLAAGLFEIDADGNLCFPSARLAAGLFEIDADGNLVKEVGRQDPPVTPALCAALA